jgi:hypothetical protein
VAAGWHLVTATFDGVTATLYVDNIVVASDLSPPRQIPPTRCIGRYFGGNGYGWNGAIDEVYLYDRALLRLKSMAYISAIPSKRARPHVAVRSPGTATRGFKLFGDRN